MHHFADSGYRYSELAGVVSGLRHDERKLGAPHGVE
jgi:hypothetical protein